MDYEDFVERLPELRQEAQRLREQAEVSSKRASGIEKIIEGVEAVSGLKPESPAESALEATAVSPDGGPLLGIAAVRAVMREHPGRVWSASEVHHALEERGWSSPNVKKPIANTESAIWRLHEKGEIKRIEKGRYEYVGKGV